MKSCIFRNRHNLIFWLIAAPANNKCSLMECENKHMPWAKINSVYSTIDSNNCFTCENPRTIIHNVLLFLLLSILLQPSYALNIQGFLLYYLNVDIFLIVKHVSCIFTKKHMVPRVHFLKNKVQESSITSICWNNFVSVFFNSRVSPAQLWEKFASWRNWSTRISLGK